ncbi:MAG: sigma-54 dependent transcriptional regulator [Proteobacteria bacterium]|nr:sigma-54 dependent transcriptional regulator [Pseudomonadota bacterium]
MPKPKTDELTFLKEAIACMTGSLDLQEAMINTFAYLETIFPIEAISLHQFSSKLQSLKLYFLVTRGRFDFVETTVPIDNANTPGLMLHNKGLELHNSVPDNRKNPVTLAHSKALDHLMPFKGRAYQIAMLKSDEEIIGHLCLMGFGVNCFTAEHEKMIKLLLKPFALVMTNLLKYKRTIEFQKKLYAQHEKLKKDIVRLHGRHIIGEQNGLKKVMDLVYQLRGSDVPALILGETGTGKELIADAIQEISLRKSKPFVKVNCGAIPDTLIDSELFGVEKGAYTGATSPRSGKFEQAQGGTLFLDEIGELPLQAQVRLLRVLQNNVIQRVGSTKSIDIDIRIIAATNRNLEQMIQKGTFREDLYYRLHVFPIHIPPLRERPQDIPELIYLFARNHYGKLNIEGHPHVTRETLDSLLQYTWPGNVRELENLIKRAITMSSGGPLRIEKLLPQDAGWYLPPEKGGKSPEINIDERVKIILEEQLSKLGLYPSEAKSPSFPKGIRTLKQATIEAIQAALHRSNGKIHGPGGAAELLDINPHTLRSKMKKLNLHTTGDGALPD